MAVYSSRSLQQAVLRASKASFLPIRQSKTAAPKFFLSPFQSYNQQTYRNYSTQNDPPKSEPPKSEPPKSETPKVELPKIEPNAKGGSSSIPLLIGIAALGGGAYYAYSQGLFEGEKKPFEPKFEDYQNVYNAIAKKLADETEYDDGSYGPVLLRLAWHASGTYDKETNTGGSNGATMRFDPIADENLEKKVNYESGHGANAGLAAARAFLSPIQKQFSWITFSDLWTLAGVAAIQEMQGPTIPWRPGRQDRDVSFCTPDGRLPDASKSQGHLRDIFYRMGFNDQEIVALSGAHALGRCHTDRSGFDGPWTFSPITITNDYFTLLVGEKWQWKKWKGPAQYEDKKTKTLMMLPTDMALVKDPSFKKHVDKYAADADIFFKDFSDVITKLFELGVPFKVPEEQRFRFKPLE